MQIEKSIMVLMKMNKNDDRFLSMEILINLYRNSKLEPGMGRIFWPGPRSTTQAAGDKVFGSAGQYSTAS